MTETERWDVVVVDLAMKKVRVLDQAQTRQDAVAMVWMAVGRRGVAGEFFVPVPAGTYQDGDTWSGPRDEA